MHSNVNVKTAGSLMRWGGLFAVVLAIVVGILSMHVIVGMPAATMNPTSMSSTVVAPANTAHHASGIAHALPGDGTGGGHVATEPTRTLALCDCMPSGCAASMAMHGGCIPSIGPAVLSVPLPGIHTQLAAPAVFSATPGHKSSGRVPDPPSLNQLSISRT